MNGLQLLGLLNNLPREDLTKEVVVECDGWHYSIYDRVETAKVKVGFIDDDAFPKDHNVLVLTSDC